jgi:predicted DCC family thiol-disulfide oxidoreductase YuxK
MQLILFDGHCMLCNRSILWIIRNDRSGIFEFAPLQSDYAKKKLSERGYSFQTIPDSVCLLNDKGVYFESNALLEIVSKIPRYHYLSLFRILPTWFRNLLYRFIARNRHRIWGKTEKCLIPDSKLKDRIHSGEHHS